MPRRVLSCPAFALAPAVLFGLTALCLVGCAHHPDSPPPGGPDFGPAPGDRLFISPAGEPFRAPHNPEQRWFAGADRDDDGHLIRAEFVADAMRFFAVLDQGGDGEIDPADIDRYETVVAPEIRVRGGNGGGRSGSPRDGRGGGGPGGGGGRGGPPGGGDRDPAGGATPTRAGLQGAARYGYLALPEPVVAADRNMNRGIDRAEMQAAAEQRFATLDTDHDGKITRSELPRLN
ncbi:EF-hand domain-containing protein [Sphingomonas mollis]|uniref:EF-hand domain-containing protein n=1 Tax=Sphingomonas mollis TaxID=2795726 RepID=A0ABS0XRC7_9SPHN|nr:EF-hand domain-containing protein [Sphingomonas sp. BT553]MBJ6122607.1 EF-hand domain-containing protein [Sphingomonas sp. BT553]